MTDNVQTQLDTLKAHRQKLIDEIDALDEKGDFLGMVPLLQQIQAIEQHAAELVMPEVLEALSHD